MIFTLLFGKMHAQTSLHDRRHCLCNCPVPRRPFLVLLVMMLAVAGVSAQSVPDDSDDAQFWNETTVAIPLKRKENADGSKTDTVNLNILATLRLGRGGLNPVDKRLGFGFDIRLNKAFILSPSYYFRAGEPVTGQKETEHRLRLDLATEKKFSPVSLKWRGRLEHRFRLDSSDSTRLRNKGTLKIPVKANNKELFSPFVAEEIFFEFQSGRFSSHEFTAGVSKELVDGLSAELFYIRKDNRSGDVRTINGIGLNLKIYLGR